MTAQLDIVADDYALSPATSAGIREAHLHGIVTATSIMANGPELISDIAALDETPELRCGAHLVLTDGPTCSDAAELLLGTDGLMSQRQFLKHYLTQHRKTLSAVKGEWYAQLARLRDCGLSITHIDSHHHVHTFPGIGQITIELAQHFGITRLRASDDRSFLKRPAYWPIYAWSKRLRHTARRAGLIVNDSFHGGAFIHAPDAEKARVLATILTRLRQYRNGTHELYCHPGKLDTTINDPYQHGRVAELEALTGAIRGDV